MKSLVITALATLGLLSLVACQSPLTNTSAIGSQARAISSTYTGDVTIKALANGKYVCADNAGSSALIANRDSAQGWETFTVVPMGGDNIALKAKANGKFVCADNWGNNALIANRDSASDWETFTLVSMGGDNFALKAKVNGKYVCADNAGSSALIANRDSAQGWETFTIVPVGVSPSPTPTNSPVPPNWSWPSASGTYINGNQTVSPVSVQKSGAFDSIVPPQTGMMVSNNTWGIGDPFYNGTGAATIFSETVNNTNVFGWSWNLSPLKANSVITYQEVGWGWSPNSSGWWNGSVPLYRISDGKKYTVDFNLKRTNRSGTWNTAFDIWIYPMTNPTGGSGGFKGGYELMIWLDHEQQGPWGSNPQSVNINGTNWTAYNNDGSAGWKVLTYINSGAAINDGKDFNLSAFFNDIVSRYGVPAGDYINAIEFGNESCGGQGMLEVANYAIKIQ